MGGEKRASSWRIAECISKEKLATALSEWEEKGINPRFIIFAGLAQTEAPGLISAREPVIAPVFYMIGKATDA